MTRLLSARSASLRAPFRSLLLATTLAAAGALPAHAADMRDGGHRGGEMGAGMMFSGSPERVSRHVDRFLDRVGATDAQRSQIKQIALAAAAELGGQRDAARSLRQRYLEVFTAPNVDARAAESVRQQLSAQHDQTSRRMLQAMLDVSRVLTPEQRNALAERAREHLARQQDRMQRESGRQ